MCCRPSRVSRLWLLAIALAGGIPDTLDAVFRWRDNITYFFKGSSYWAFDDEKKQTREGYPREISERWRGVPNDLDAVFRWSDGRTYFFKDDKYYEFDDDTGHTEADYPKKISEGWSGIPDGVNAVFRAPETGHTIFFKNEFIYLFNDTRREMTWCSRIDGAWTFACPVFPAKLNGVPNDLDAAFVWSDDAVYMFKSTEYYRYNATTRSVEGGYPKKIKLGWPDPVQGVGWAWALCSAVVVCPVGGVVAFLAAAWPKASASEPAARPPWPLALTCVVAAVLDLGATMGYAVELWLQPVWWTAVIYTLAVVATFASGITAILFYLDRESKSRRVRSWLFARNTQVAILVVISSFNLPAFQLIGARVPRLDFTEIPISRWGTRCIKQMFILSATAETTPKLMAQTAIAIWSGTSVGWILALSTSCLDILLLVVLLHWSQTAAAQATSSRASTIGTTELSMAEGAAGGESPADAQTV